MHRIALENQIKALEETLVYATECTNDYYNRTARFERGPAILFALADLTQTAVDMVELIQKHHTTLR